MHLRRLLGGIELGDAYACVENGYQKKTGVRLKMWRMGIVVGMIIEGNGRDEWNGQPAVGTMSMKEDEMGMEVGNGAG